MKTEPAQCLRCKEIITFCECKASITDKDEYIKVLEVAEAILTEKLIGYMWLERLGGRSDDEIDGIASTLDEPAVK